jgi:hypothetical protein
MNLNDDDDIYSDPAIGLYHIEIRNNWDHKKLFVLIITDFYMPNQ